MTISREEFHNIYIEKFEPVLMKLEKERAQVYSKLKIYISIFIAGLFLSFVVMLIPFIGLIFIPILFIIAIPMFYTYTTWRNNIKKNIISKLLPLYGNFYYSTAKNLIPLSQIKSFGLYPSATSKTDDDIIIGIHNGCNILINECKLEGTGKYNKVKFLGLILKVQMKKKFHGTTVVGQNVHPIKGLEPVELESVDFMKDMDVYSTDQIEARYLLTTNFIEKLQELGKAFNSALLADEKYNSYNSNVAYKTLVYNRISDYFVQSKVSAIFHEGYVYLFVPNCNDFFEIQYYNSLLNEQKYYNIFNEMSQILSIIDYLNLDKNIGL